MKSYHLNKLFKYLILISCLLVVVRMEAQTKTICVAADCRDTIKLPQDTVTLNALGSSTSPITGYVWKQISGPSATIDNILTNATVARGLNTPGLYIFSVTAASSVGFASINDTVLVQKAQNIPPIAVITGARNISTTDSLVLSGASSTDADGNIVMYSWTGQNVTLTSLTTATIKGLTVGSYTYGLTVTDNNGATNTAFVTITVTTPTVTLVATVYIGGKTLSIFSDGSVITK